MASISTLLVETFLIDLGVSNSAQKPFAWDVERSRQYGSLTLRFGQG